MKNGSTEADMLSGKTLDWDRSDPETALTLPSRYFYDPEIFARETETIFFPSSSIR